MDSNEFGLALLGDPIWHKDGQRRIRHIVADAFEERAAERRAEGRPDVAGRLQWAATQMRHGDALTKRVCGKLSKDIRIIESRVVDGISSARYPSPGA